MALSDLKKAMLEAADYVKQSAKEIEFKEVFDSAKEVIQKEVQMVKETDYKALAEEIKSTVEEKVEQVKQIDMEEVKASIKTGSPKEIKETITDILSKEEEVDSNKIALVESLRIIYILITIDQNIDSLELETFNTIFKETGLPEQVRDSITFEGKQILAKAKQSNSFEEINAYVIKLLTTPKAGEHKVSKEWLLWKLLSIAYVDGEYSISERKLIYSVCETLEVEDAILIEMENTINHRTKNELNDEFIENINKWNRM